MCCPSSYRYFVMIRNTWQRCSENLDCRGGYRKTVINNEHNTILCHLDITIVKYSAIEVLDQLELSLGS